MPTISTCPQADAWQQLMAGGLPSSTESLLNAHLETCPRCQEAVHALVAGHHSWSRLPRQLCPGQPAPDPALKQAMSRLTEELGAAETQTEASPVALPLDFLAPPSKAGTIGLLGRYEVQEVLGQGGMGVVFKAFDPELHRAVAIKVMAPVLAAAATARQRFLREARSAASISHQNVAAVHEIGEAKGLPFIVVHYVAGPSLEQRVAQGPPLGVEEIARIGRQIAEGLAAVHARGLVHRDIKPANILLEQGSGTVKITDFGLAQARDDARLTQSGVVTGTPHYMAPEQARGETVDHRADLFALGGVLYVLCTGTLPFPGASPLAVLRRITDDAPAPVPSLNPGIPAWLVGIVDRLLAKDPARRFQSAAEVAQLLSRHLGEVQPPTARPCRPSVPAEVARSPRIRSRVWMLAGLAASLAVVLGTTGYFLATVLLPHDEQRSTPETQNAAQAVAAGDLARQARGLLTTFCYRCHGQDGAVEGGFNYLLDRDRLVARKKIVPGQPGKSRLLRKIIEGEMPPEEVKRRPGKDDIAVLTRWIEAGAPAFEAAPATPTFIAPDRTLHAIRADLEKRGLRDRRFTRYFTLTHLYNAGFSEDEMQTYRNGISKLLNSLSWNKQIVVPAPVDKAGTVLRVDLRGYRWSEREWDALVAGYPYALSDGAEAEKYYIEVTGCATPYMRGDWFVARAARPPLYHELLQLPKSEGELEKLLHIDVAANIRADRVARAGFNSSGVSRNNRLIERHETPYGAYWKSYDFAENAGAQNLFERPLGPGSDERSFHHVGGEIIFNLPNGLQGYLLVNGQGKRLDKAPTEIVSDPRRPDRAVENGLSCMACHSRGINLKDDQVRAHVEKNPGAFPKDEAETILPLYPPAPEFRRLQKADAERFERAAAATGARTGKTEPILALALQYEGPLDARRAAAEVGLRPRDFLARLERSPELQRSLGPIQLAGGTIPRQVFDSVFVELASTGKVGTPVRLRPAELSPAVAVKERSVVDLPEPFDQVKAGGGGRFLIFSLKKAKKLAIVDAFKGRIVREIEVPTADVRYAAGRDKLLVVLPGQKIIHRYDLRTFERDKTAPVPGGGTVLTCLMGSSSQGPLGLWCGGNLILMDVGRMEELQVEGNNFNGSAQWGFGLRVSADGQTFLGWNAGLTPARFAVMRLSGAKAATSSADLGSYNGQWATPNADGGLIIRYDGHLFSRSLRDISADGLRGWVIQPTEDPRFFLAARGVELAVCTTADRRAVLTLKDKALEKMDASSLGTRWYNAEGEPASVTCPGRACWFSWRRATSRSWSGPST